MYGGVFLWDVPVRQNSYSKLFDEQRCWVNTAMLYISYLRAIGEARELGVILKSHTHSG